MLTLPTGQARPALSPSLSDLTLLSHATEAQGAAQWGIWSRVQLMTGWREDMRGPGSEPQGVGWGGGGPNAPPLASIL